MPRNEKIDEYIARSEPYARAILKKLRALVHEACPDAEERIKWGAPAFDCKGPLFMMAARKRHVAAGFWKDEGLGDKPARVKLQQLASLDQLPSDAVLLKLLKAHARLNDAAAIAPRKKRARTTPRAAEAAAAGRALRFAAKIKIREGNPYVLVSAARAEALKPGWRKPMPVLVQVNGAPATPWRINMMPRGDGAFYLYLHGEVRTASETRVGDKVDVSLRFDDEYAGGPQHPMPPWFGQALDDDKKARANWERLPPSRQKEVLRYFAGLKSDDARARNLAKVLEVLSGKPGRFMARDWKDGK